MAPDPHDPNIVYAGEYFGILTRWDQRTGQAQNIMVWPDDLDGHEAAAVKYRFNWTEPIIASKHNPGTVYYAGNIVFKSMNGGMSWTEISKDLTRNEKAKQGRSGGPITGENISIEYYNVVFTLAESPVQKNMLWAGTDDGLIHVTRDEGKTWTNVTPSGLPEGMISILDASPHSAESAYFAMDRHKFDDFTPYIYRTHDGGKSWTRINKGIPDGTFVRAVRVDPKKKGLLYAGTETGIYVSFNDGDSWQRLQLNLPITPVHDLVVQGDDLAVATHGRSFWILDDLSPLRQITDQVAAADAHLYTPAPALRWRPQGGAGAPFAGTRIRTADDFSYTDPVDGSVSAKQGIRLLLADGSRVVCRLSGTGTEGATLRLYLERFARDGGSDDPQTVLAPLVHDAKALLQLKEFCDREEPTVIT